MSIRKIADSFFGKSTSTIDSLNGGDINHAASISNGKERYFVKYDTYDNGRAMLEYEAQALKTFSALDVLVPEVFKVGSFHNTHYLILEYLKEESSSVLSSESLSQNLAHIHNKNEEYFGWKDENYLGDFRFEGGFYDSWSECFWFLKLKPLISKCAENSLLDKKYLKREEQFIQKLESKIPSHSPSLVHGDLWNGNVLKCNSKVYFIDPACFYAHPDLDFAMMNLFGGFPKNSLSIYREMRDYETSDFNLRMRIHQSYYLLFHLYKFGRSYYSQTINSLDSILR